MTDFENDPFFKDPKGYFKRAKRRMIIGALLVSAVFGAFMYFINKDLEHRQAEVKSRVGQNVVLGGDTLMIIDYSVWQKNYTLNDGRKIDWDLAAKLQLTP